MSAESFARLWQDLRPAVAVYLSPNAPVPELLFVEKVEPGHWPQAARLRRPAGCRLKYVEP